jgi:hypothetical protein
MHRSQLGTTFEGGASMKEKETQDKSECLKRAAEVRRFARETGDPVEKVDLFSVERRWRSLAEPSEEDIDS